MAFSIQYLEHLFTENLDITRVVLLQNFAKSVFNHFSVRRK